MALANYTDLINSINGSGAWLHRKDLAAIAPDWVTLCEATINYGDLAVIGVDGLRVSEQETAWTSASSTPAVTTANSDAVTLPDDFLEMRRLRLLTSGSVGIELIPRPALPIPRGTLANSAGRPSSYMVSGNTLVFDRPCNQAYPLVGTYYAKVGPLATSGTNWLMTKSPMVYLTGSIAHGAPWLGPNFNPQPWITGFKVGMAQIRRADARKRVGQVTLRTEAARMVNRQQYDGRSDL